MEQARPSVSLRELEAYLAQRGVDLPTGTEPFMFGNTPELAIQLAALVATGQKAATAGLLWAWEAEEGGPPHERQVYVVQDWEGTPITVIEITHVHIVPFNGVEPGFAQEEGEGDRSLEWWRRTHWRYFAAECQRLGREPTADMPVVCLRFRVVPPPGVEEAGPDERSSSSRL